MKRPILFLFVFLVQTTKHRRFVRASSETDSSFSSSSAAQTVRQDATSMSHRPVLYTPELDEYDPFTFDPTNSMGSPYGGYARATMSRLAALPIRLVGSVDTASSMVIGAGFYPRSAKVDSLDAPHFTMYNAHGQLLVCRVYNEDELSMDSVTQSMFDVAMEAQSDAILPQTLHSSSLMEDPNPIPTTRTIPPPTQTTTTIHNEEIRAQLNKLKGVCSQLSTGYWNYQWCHGAHFLQFHSVHDLTVVGYFDETARRILAKPSSSSSSSSSSSVSTSPTIATEDTSATMIIPSSVVRVEDSFIQGDFCSAANKVRTATVTLKCCKLDEWNSVRGLQQEELGYDIAHYDDDTHEVMAQLIQLKEESTCSYTALVCTNVLCRKSFQSYIQARQEEGDTSSSSSSTEVRDTSSIHKLKSTARPIQRFQKDESIRHILQQTLDQCLTINLGWWTYSLCYASKITQFHLEVKFDPRLGQGSLSLNAEKHGEHVLGVYDAKAMSSWTKEDERSHVVFPQGDVENPIHPHSETVGQSSQAFPDGSGAYYMEEYTHGDLCNHSDVTESVIKGGSTIQGGLERTSVVRYSCGKELKLLRVYEESTCKYVLDVTVPELCFHSFFEAPAVNTQVIKCLPV